MYCLVVTDVYSRFTWVFFLATKDETSGILKSFITRIENLIAHKVKVIICDNGTEFKNREMNQFCEMKVNTACYVQNRVLVVKLHNKTPYELFHDRTPTLIFMRPFGCLVTILNTIDHLGKFDGKANEGFFVGYSLNNKAFRVFNSRTRIVEENLHIRFSENTLNVVGSGPDWLFDIDALTKIINYEPILAGTQSNGFAGTKASDNAGQARKETEHVKYYFLLPLWTVDPLFYQNPKSSHNVGSKPLSDDGKKVDEDLRKEMNVMIKRRKIMLTTLAMLIFTFNFTSNDEDDGRIADMNNLDTTIQVSPIITIRTHKNHPLDQVIGDLQLAIQTRNMSKNLEEHGFDPSWIEAMQEELLQFKDETSGILKSFITRIENLIAHKVKVIICDNGTEFKNREMNQFCEMKDHLGKFNGKANEGFFVGYSLNNKAFRVFNSRTRIVEENLHIRFSKNTLNVVFSGPDWLFDIDALTRIVNYEPILAGTQSNGFADNKLPFDPNMPALEDVSTFNFTSNDEDDGIIAYMNNLDTTIQVSPIITTRIHKNHPLDQVIGDLQSAIQTRNMSKNLEEHGFCKKQTLVANSTTKAEYVAASSCCGKVLWIQNQLLDYGKGFSGRITPLFPTMVVQSQLDEGSTMPTDPHHTPTILQSSSYQPQKTHKPRKPTRKVTQVPQPSDPIEHVADEVAHKELGDNLVRAATTASRLEAEQDSGGPRCQEAMRDTTAQTRFESISKHSNDLLLSRGNTLQTNDDRMKLNELMELCTNLQKRVLDLEKTKTTQGNKIDSLKRRVKKLKKKQRLRTYKLKRLYKVRLTARVESLNNEESLGEDASKQGRRIDDIDADEDIILMFDKEFKRVNTFEDFITELVQGKEKRAGEELIQESAKKQKVKDDKETAELKQLIEIILDKEEVAIDAIPLAFKSPRIVGWKVYKEGKKSYYQIIRADRSSKMYMFFQKMLKSFDIEDLKDLYKLVKARYGSTGPVEDLNLLL
nr:hypothetical protein [Tanacetum cinerariifolium]